MEDAPEDRDVKVQKYSGYWYSKFTTLLPALLYEDADGIALEELAKSEPENREIRRTLAVDAVEGAVALLEPFQEYPQLLDPHLAPVLSALTVAFVGYLLSPSDEGNLPANVQTLPEGVARLLYTLCKIRGWKVICRFLPNEPHLLQAIVSRLEFKAVEKEEEADPLEKAVKKSWELRYILLLWLAHLLLTPFDLSSISAPEPETVNAHQKGFIPSAGQPIPERLRLLSPLSKTLLLLGAKFASSPSPREADAAALLVVRLAQRKDMFELGVLDCLVSWCLGCLTDGNASEPELRLLGGEGASTLFSRLGALKVLAGIIAQESKLVRKFIKRVWEVLSGLEDSYSESTETQDGEPTNREKGSAGEWDNAGVRKVVTKIYRLICMILLTPMDSEFVEDTASAIIEDIIGRLLNLLGDRDTNVRFAASKSLGVLTSKLPSEMANEVIQAVVDEFDRDILYEDEPLEVRELTLATFWPENTKPSFPKRRQVLASVSAERWHGLTLTLATLLRQRVIKPNLRSEDDADADNRYLFQTIITRILTALSFEQRRTTFAIGSNVRDAACYAAWSLARSYSTTELLAFPQPDLEFLDLAEKRAINVPQLLAKNLMIVACLDPLGNIRRGASAALQELVGRHPNIIVEGIEAVQRVDYGSVSVRRRAITEVSSAAAALGQGYWEGIVNNGIINGWRGIGSADAEGRRLAARGLGRLVTIKFKEDSDEMIIERGKMVVGRLLYRWVKENKRDVEVRHGILWALAEVFEGITGALEHLSTCNPNDSRDDYSNLFTEEQRSIAFSIFYTFQARDFINPILRPELLCEASSRLISALCRVSTNILSSQPSPTITILPTLPHSLQRLFLAIIETCLDYRTEDIVFEQSIPAAKELFKILSRKNRTRIVEAWCRKVLSESKGAMTGFGTIGTNSGTTSGGSGLGRKRGLVRGLGEVASVLIAEETAGGNGGWDEYDDENEDESDESRPRIRRAKKVRVVDDVVSVLVSAATRPNDVEMRVAGIRGVSRGIMGPSTPTAFSISRFPQVIYALYGALDDYAVDSRGDVGSWVRIDAVNAVLEGWKNKVLHFGLSIPLLAGAESNENVNVMMGFIKRLIRLSVERLDKLRVKSFDCMQHILMEFSSTNSFSHDNQELTSLTTLIDFNQSIVTYSAATSPLYFSCMLPLLQSSLARKDLLRGYVTSSGAASESLLRTSASALFNYLDSLSTPRQLKPIYDSFLQILKESIEENNDRILVATLETIGWCIEMNVLLPTTRNDNETDVRFDTGNLFSLVQKAHLKTGNMQKLNAAVRVYRALGVHLAVGLAQPADENTRGLVVRKLAAMLGHPFPKVRKEVSEALYLGLTLGGERGSDQEAAREIEEVDWMRDVKSLKEAIYRVKNLVGK